MMRAKIATCALLLACSVQLNAASLPGQGASMSQVEQDFGSPLSKTGPVGTPPITRWTYDGFVVVFERSKVLHSMTVTGQQSAPRPAAPVRAPAPAPVKAQAPAAAPAQKPAAPAATTVTPTQADAAQQARLQAERDAAKARADADAAKVRAAQEAEALRKTVEATPETITPQAAPPAPTTATPAPEAAPAKRTAEDALKAAPGFSFDPATGRVILK